MHPNSTIDIHNGLILLADPYMEDPHFRRAALLICDHHADGTLGFILNKPIGMNVTSLLQDFPEFESEVCYGGPVQTDTLHFLHTQGELIRDSVEIVKGVYWGGDFEQLKACIRQGLVQPHDIRFFVGYSGWEPDQLREEIEEKSWLLAEGELNYIFYKSHPLALWKQILEHQGGSYAVIGQMDLPAFN